MDNTKYYILDCRGTLIKVKKDFIKKSEVLKTYYLSDKFNNDSNYYLDYSSNSVHLLIDYINGQDIEMCDFLKIYKVYDELIIKIDFKIIKNYNIMMLTTEYDEIKKELQLIFDDFKEKICVNRDFLKIYCHPFETSIYSYKIEHDNTEERPNEKYYRNIFIASMFGKWYEDDKFREFDYYLKYKNFISIEFTDDVAYTMLSYYYGINFHKLAINKEYIEFVRTNNTEYFTCYNVNESFSDINKKNLEMEINS